MLFQCESCCVGFSVHSFYFKTSRRSLFHYLGAKTEKCLDACLACTLRDGATSRAVLEDQTGFDFFNFDFHYPALFCLPDVQPLPVLTMSASSDSDW